MTTRMYLKGTPEERMWPRVEKTATCWLWIGRAVNNKGYGQITVAKGKSVLVHRLSYEIANGPIPEGMSVCHSCDTPACVNPAHLFLGTHSDNMRDAYRKGRLAGSIGRVGKRRPFCGRGHAMAGDNLRPRSDGGAPECRACNQITQRASEIRNPRRLRRKLA